MQHKAAALSPVGSVDVAIEGGPAHGRREEAAAQEGGDSDATLEIGLLAACG
jgi:hypothetical protein